MSTLLFLRTQAPLPLLEVAMGSVLIAQSMPDGSTTAGKAVVSAMTPAQRGWPRTALCPAPAARWRPLPADLARGSGADKGGRPASPTGPRRRRAPRVAAAAPAREPSSCRPLALCPARRALLLKDKARGGWAQAEPAGHPSLHPSPDLAPTHTPKLGPTRAWVAARSWASGAGTAPKCPPRELPPTPSIPSQRMCKWNKVG